MSLAFLSSKPSFPHGVHPEERKELAASSPIEALPTPTKVLVPLLQHRGVACELRVKPRQEVLLGELLGDSEDPVSARVHSPIAGKTAKSSVATLANGRHVEAVPIKAGPEQLEGAALVDEIYGGDWPISDHDRYQPEEIVAAVRRAGLVGMGGAAFPTYLKLARNPENPIDTLLVNGCECEPYLTADHRLMVEAPEPIVAGALLAARALGVKRIVIGVEDNKPEALSRLREAVGGHGIEVLAVATKYPQGAEKMLIHALLRRKVPFPGLPLDVGVVVINVATASAVARAVLRAGALTHRLVTVTGNGVRRPANLLAPVGASYRSLLDAAGGLDEQAARIVAGGPMMGFTVADLDAPVTKGTSGITVLNRDELAAGRETACVRCGKCIEVCPMDLMPTRIALAVRRRAWDQTSRYSINACMECGCCAWACPAQIPLVQLIRAGKAEFGKVSRRANF